MFQQKTEKRMVGPVLLVSIFAHASILFLVVLHSFWNTELHAAPVKQTVTILTPLPPPDEPIHVSLKRSQSTSSKHGGGKPPAVNTEAPPQPLSPLTQENLIPLSDPNAPEQISGPSDWQGPIGGGSEEGTAGPGADSGEGEDTIYTPREVQAPVLIHRVEPIYPPVALRLHIHGMVVMEAVVGLTGYVEDIRVLSSPHGLLTASALEALQQWRYQPAKLGTKAVRCSMNVTVNFTLH